jgi:hypothetical protein
MLDGNHLDHNPAIVDQIQNAVVASTCGPSRGERFVEGFAHPMGVVQ